MSKKTLITLESHKEYIRCKGDALLALIKIQESPFPIIHDTASLFAIALIDIGLSIRHITVIEAKLETANAKLTDLKALIEALCEAEPSIAHTELLELLKLSKEHLPE